MLEIIAFCCGALVMVLEMVGARVLAPHVGTSAVVWTSLIGVVLAWKGAGLFPVSVACCAVVYLLEMFFL